MVSTNRTENTSQHQNLQNTTQTPGEVFIFPQNWLLYERGFSYKKCKNLSRPSKPPSPAIPVHADMLCVCTFPLLHRRNEAKIFTHRGLSSEELRAEKEWKNTGVFVWCIILQFKVKKWNTCKHDRLNIYSTVQSPNSLKGDAKATVNAKKPGSSWKWISHLLVFSSLQSFTGELHILRHESH